MVIAGYDVTQRTALMANPKGNLKHGYCGTPIYGTWQNMRRRCRPGHKDFEFYGGRGIDCDPRWDDFAVFLADVGPPPHPGLQLDRIDNDKGYWPGNVRWVTRKENCLNRRSNMLLTLNGKTQTAQEWGEELGIKPATIRQRKYRGKTDVEALAQPNWAAL
jgi:hypothetical protein